MSGRGKQWLIAAGSAASIGGVFLVACGEVLPVAPIEEGPDASQARCELPADCPLIDTVPASCAAPTCVEGVCVYTAIDRDQDGHRAARCSGPDNVPIVLGDDCDDENPNLYPGHDVECAETEDGAAIAFPQGVPVGACKLGKRSCRPDGTVTACIGAVGPAPVTSCTPDVDEGCTGNPLEGCPCEAGQSTTCGSSDVGRCKKGTSTCEGGTFGPCVGNVEPAPRNCASNEDWNCDGTADAQEGSCRCPGGVAPGGERACDTHPGLDGKGVCKAGKQTCVASGSTSAWSACSGSVGPSPEQCDSLDRDCDGVAGIDRPSPAPPAGTLNCAKTFACPAPGRGALYYRDGIGFTNFAGSNTRWTGYAPRGDFSSGTYPAGHVRISRDATATKMGPVGVNTACCAGGCPTANVFFDAEGQFYTLP